MNLEGLTIGAILTLGVGMISACSGQNSMYVPPAGEHRGMFIDTTAMTQGCTSDVAPEGSCQASGPVAIASHEACDGEDCSPQASLEDDSVQSVLHLRQEVSRYCNRGTSDWSRDLATPVTFAAH